MNAKGDVRRKMWRMLYNFMKKIGLRQTRFSERCWLNSVTYRFSEWFTEED